MKTEEWITTESGGYSKIEDMNHPERYTSESGKLYLLTKKKTITEHHMYGYQICEICGNPIGVTPISYADHEVCSPECLTKLIKKLNW
jgi:hypothetical protein